MKPAPHHILIAVMAVVIAALTWTLVYLARDELQLHDEEYEEEIESAMSASFEDGRAIVRVGQKSQEASGIRALALKAEKHASERQIFGIVTDIAPLLELRGRYFAAVGEQGALRADRDSAETEYQRAKVLYEDDRNVSEQVMRNAEGRYRMTQARLNASHAVASVTRDALLADWGVVVGGWATDAQSRSLEALLSSQSALVQVVFPYDFPHRATDRKLRMALIASRAQMFEARFVSAAPRASTTVPGSTYFYLAHGAGLRTGARVVADVSVDGVMFEGVVIPEEAVVWHAGKSWVYRKHDEDTFGRYEVTTNSEVGNGWFQPTGFKPGDEIVTSGAQLLLSEELKFQIRNENED